MVFIVSAHDLALLLFISFFLILILFISLILLFLSFHFWVWARFAWDIITFGYSWFSVIRLVLSFNSSYFVYMLRYTFTSCHWFLIFISSLLISFNFQLLFLLLFFHLVHSILFFLCFFHMRSLSLQSSLNNSHQCIIFKFIFLYFFMSSHFSFNSFLIFHIMFSLDFHYFFYLIYFFIFILHLLTYFNY